MFCYGEHMRERLGEFELIVLLALVRLGDDAYGVPVRREIEKRTKRSVTVGALYRTLGIEGLCIVLVERSYDASAGRACSETRSDDRRALGVARPASAEQPGPRLVFCRFFVDVIDHQHLHGPLLHL